MATFKDVLVLVDKVSKPLQNISNNTDKATGKLKKFNDNLVALKPAFNGAWGGVMKLTKGIIGLVGSSGVITMGIAKVTEFADNIDKMSQKIGMSTDAYQKWNYIMSINGGNVDSLAMGFKTLTTQIEGVQKGSKDSIKSFRMLGVNVKDNNGKFRAQESIFEEVIQKLQRMENKTQRDVIANRLFGRSASELRPLLNQSADAIDKLAKNFEKYGMKLTKKEIENATQFKDTWTTFTMFLQAQTNKALTELLPKLTGIVQKIMEYKQPIQDIISGVGKLAIKVFEVVGFFKKHKVLLATILGIITGLGAVNLYIAIVSGISMMTTALAAFGVTSNIALGGIPLLIGAIVGAITFLALNWKKIWNGIKNFTKKIIDGIVNFVNSLLEKLGFLAYLIPGLNGLVAGVKIAQGVASHINKNKVEQTQKNSIINNTTNNTYYGNGNLRSQSHMSSSINQLYAY